MLHKYKLILVILLGNMFVIPCFSQLTKVMGVVTDKETKEVLPFVTVMFKNTTIGTITDFNGKYKIETSKATDSLIFSCLGYKPVTKKIIKNRFQELNIELENDKIILSEVVVKYNKKFKNPALDLFDKIIENKPINNFDKFEYYQYNTYNRIQFDINNITEDFKNRTVMKPFQFVFNYVDTSTLNGKAYLPVFLIESLSDYYYRKNPKTEKEFIKATKVSGIKNKSIQEFLGNMYLKVNVYDNFIDIFGKGFVSPISSAGKLYYKYFLTDSAFIDNNWCYQLVFEPRNKQDYVFKGNMWINDTSFAVKKIEMRIANEVNINFVNTVEISQEFIKVDTNSWMIDREVVVVDFNMFTDPKNTMGFFGRRTSVYKNHRVNIPAPDSIYNNLNNVVVSNDAHDKNMKYWDEERFEELTDKEKIIYHMVDTIKTIPAFKTFIDVVTMFVTYYYVKGNFELGPYFTLYSFNPVEGHRFRFGARTSNKFSTKFMPEAYIAYGTKDQQFKYGGNLIWLYKKLPRRGLSIAYKNDMEQLGKSINAFREDNILASVMRRGPNNKISMTEEIRATLEHEWFLGLSNKIIFMHRTIFPYGGLPDFVININDHVRRHFTNFTTTDLVLYTRFIYREKVVMGEFVRQSLGSKWPEIELTLTHGFKNTWNSNFTYNKLDFSIYHWINIYPFGYIKYYFEAGKVWGKLPYVLLKLHEGNETLSFDMYSFNMMNYYEFVSDQYLSLYWAHYFEGLFFNKIPLFKRLKLREVAWGKGVIGSLNDNNRAYMDFPEYLHTLSKPYLEGGLGIENILKLIRVDYVWRFSYLDHPNISKHGIRISLEVKF